MSLTFAANFDSVEGTQILPDNFPITISAWFKPSALLVDMAIAFKTSLAAQAAIGIRIRGNVANDPLSSFIDLGGSFNNIQGGSTQVGVWQHAAARFLSSSHTVYLNGAEVATGSHSIPFSTADLVSIGARRTPPVIFEGFVGDIAEVAIYSADIGVEGVTMLAKGVSPLLVYGSRTSLVDYWPLLVAGSQVGYIRGTQLTDPSGAGGSALTAPHVSPILRPTVDYVIGGRDVIRPAAVNISVSLETTNANVSLPSTNTTVLV